MAQEEIILVNSSVQRWLQAQEKINSNFDELYAGIGAGVPDSRTLTINGVTYDLSANRSWTVSGGVSDGDKGDITVSSSGTVWTIDTGLDPAKLADGSVSATEFQYINSLSSNAQTQIDAKVSQANVRRLIRR